MEFQNRLTIKVDKRDNFKTTIRSLDVVISSPLDHHFNFILSSDP